MEDQQADPGVLTPDPGPGADSDDTSTARRVPVGKRKRARGSETAPVDDAAAAEAVEELEAALAVDLPPGVEEPEPGPEPADSPDSADSGEGPVPGVHRPAGRRWLIAAAAAAVVFVAAGGFAGAMVQPYLADRALVATKMEVARTAAEAITTLWTYTPEDMEDLPNRADKYLSGDFSDQYRRFIDAIVVSNKQSQVTNNTEVVGTAVESISPTEATAIVYTNSVATSPVTKNIPSLRYLSYRLTMERKNSEWLINRMTAITQLDLTPQL